MAIKKLTKKDLEQMIEDRDKSIKELVRKFADLESEIWQIKNNADDDFCNSATYKQMKSEIERLNVVIKAHENTIEAKENTIIDKMNVIQKLRNENEQLKQDIKCKQDLQVVNKLKNERNAGRKRKFTDDEKATIQLLRLADNSYRAIAKQMGCSVGTIYNIIKEIEQE